MMILMYNSKKVTKIKQLKLVNKPSEFFKVNR